MRCTAVLLGLLALAAAPRSAAAQTEPPPAPRTILTFPESGASPAFIGLTRDPRGYLYLGAPNRGVVVYAPGASSGVRLRDARGDLASGSKFSWIGDTLAIEGWNEWDLFTANGPAGCLPSTLVHNEFATQVFATRPIRGGLVVGELLPPWPDERVGERLVVARNQEVVRILARRAPGPESIDVPDPRSPKSGSWEVEPPVVTRNLWSVADREAGVIVVEQRAPQAGGAQPVRVVRVSLAGETLYSASLRLPAIVLTDAERERVIGELAKPARVAMIAERDSAVRHEAFRRLVPLPRYYPPVTDVPAGADGSAWLRLAPEGEHVRWLKLDSAGLERFRVETVRDFHPLHADADGLWGLRRSAADQLNLVQYSNTLPASPTLILPDTMARGVRWLGPRCPS